jgi:hypothetical protein
VGKCLEHGFAGRAERLPGAPLFLTDQEREVGK